VLLLIKMRGEAQANEKWLALTRQVGHVPELLFPELGDGDGVDLVVVALRRHPLLARVAHDLLQVFRVHSVLHIEEILTRRASVLRELVREVDVHRHVLRELRPQRLDGELVVARHLARLHLGFLEQLFSADQHVLQQVLVDDGLVREIVLY